MGVMLMAVAFWISFQIWVPLGGIVFILAFVAYVVIRFWAAGYLAALGSERVHPPTSFLVLWRCIQVIELAVITALVVAQEWRA
jgi:hypothetical protein